MYNYARRDEIFEKLKFLTSWENWNCAANEKTVDLLFQCALELEEIFTQEKQNNFELSRNCDLDINEPVNALLEGIIKCQNFDENVTLYAINKYSLLHKNFPKFLEKFLLEVDLRNELFKMFEECSDADLNFFKLNNFLCGILMGSDLKSKVFYAIKSQALIFLKAIRHSDFIISQSLMNEMIDCLESQTDLKLWFIIMKDENFDIILELCVFYNNFLKAVLKFFDKFADEIESTYDEDLNIQYSHVNFDFEKFVDILQLFLNKSSIKSIISEYLESKTLIDKNFYFWADVKACL